MFKVFLIIINLIAGVELRYEMPDMETCVETASNINLVKSYPESKFICEQVLVHE